MKFTLNKLKEENAVELKRLRPKLLAASFLGEIAGGIEVECKKGTPGEFQQYSRNIGDDGGPCTPSGPYWQHIN